MSDYEAPIDRASVRRQVVLMLLVFDLLALSIGVVAAIDLRRLNTPEGTALRWVQAAVFGDCDDFLRFSVADPALPESRGAQAHCQDLREATADARNLSLTIGLSLTGVQREGDTATATLVLVRQQDTLPVTVHLVHRSDGWRVLRDATTCASAGCG